MRCATIPVLMYVDLLTSRGWNGSVGNLAPITVFAPTNAALQALPAGVLDEARSDPAALADILRGTVVAGRFNAADLATAASLTTLANTQLAVTNAAAPSRSAARSIGSPEVLAENGVIQPLTSIPAPSCPTGLGQRLLRSRSPGGTASPDRPDGAGRSRTKAMPARGRTTPSSPRRSGSASGGAAAPAGRTAAAHGPARPSRPVINANSTTELASIGDAADAAGARANTGLRITLPGMWAGQFGIPSTSPRLVGAIEDPRRDPRLDLVGLHAHRGGRCAPPASSPRTSNRCSASVASCATRRAGCRPSSIWAAAWRRRPSGRSGAASTG